MSTGPTFLSYGFVRMFQLNSMEAEILQYSGLSTDRHLSYIIKSIFPSLVTFNKKYDSFFITQTDKPDNSKLYEIINIIKQLKLSRVSMRKLFAENHIMNELIKAISYESYQEFIISKMNSKLNVVETLLDSIPMLFPFDTNENILKTQDDYNSTVLSSANDIQDLDLIYIIEWQIDKIVTASQNILSNISNTRTSKSDSWTIYFTQFITFATYSLQIFLQILQQHHTNQKKKVYTLLTDHLLIPCLSLFQINSLFEIGHHHTLPTMQVYEQMLCQLLSCGLFDSNSLDDIFTIPLSNDRDITVKSTKKLKKQKKTDEGDIKMISNKSFKSSFHIQLFTAVSRYVTKIRSEHLDIVSCSVSISKLLFLYTTQSNLIRNSRAKVPPENEIVGQMETSHRGMMDGDDAGEAMTSRRHLLRIIHFATLLCQCINEEMMKCIHFPTDSTHPSSMERGHPNLLRYDEEQLILFHQFGCIQNEILRTLSESFVGFILPQHESFSKYRSYCMTLRDRCLLSCLAIQIRLHSPNARSNVYHSLLTNILSGSIQSFHYLLTIDHSVYTNCSLSLQDIETVFSDDDPTSHQMISSLPHTHSGSILTFVILFMGTSSLNDPPSHMLNQPGQIPVPSKGKVSDLLSIQRTLLMDMFQLHVQLRTLPSWVENLIALDDNECIQTSSSQSEVDPGTPTLSMVDQILQEPNFVRVTYNAIKAIPSTEAENIWKIFHKNLSGHIDEDHHSQTRNPPEEVRDENESQNPTSDDKATKKRKKRKGSSSVMTETIPNRGQNSLRRSSRGQSPQVSMKKCVVIRALLSGHLQLQQQKSSIVYLKEDIPIEVDSEVVYHCTTQLLYGVSQSLLWVLRHSESHPDLADPPQTYRNVPQLLTLLNELLQFVVKFFHVKLPILFQPIQLNATEESTPCELRPQKIASFHSIFESITLPMIQKFEHLISDSWSTLYNKSTSEWPFFMKHDLPAIFITVLLGVLFYEKNLSVLSHSIHRSMHSVLNVLPNSDHTTISQDIETFLSQLNHIFTHYSSSENWDMVNMTCPNNDSQLLHSDQLSNLYLRIFAILLENFEVLRENSDHWITPKESTTSTALTTILMENLFRIYFRAIQSIQSIGNSPVSLSSSTSDSLEVRSQLLETISHIQKIVKPTQRPSGIRDSLDYHTFCEKAWILEMTNTRTGRRGAEGNQSSNSSDRMIRRNKLVMDSGFDAVETVPCLQVVIHHLIDCLDGLSDGRTDGQDGTRIHWIIKGINETARWIVRYGMTTTTPTTSNPVKREVLPFFHRHDTPRMTEAEGVDPIVFEVIFQYVDVLEATVDRWKGDGQLDRSFDGFILLVKRLIHEILPLDRPSIWLDGFDHLLERVTVMVDTTSSSICQMKLPQEIFETVFHRILQMMQSIETLGLVEWKEVLVHLLPRVMALIDGCLDIETARELSDDRMYYVSILNQIIWNGMEILVMIQKDPFDPSTDPAVKQLHKEVREYYSHLVPRLIQRIFEVNQGHGSERLSSGSSDIDQRRGYLSLMNQMIPYYLQHCGIITKGGHEVDDSLTEGSIRWRQLQQTLSLHPNLSGSDMESEFHWDESRLVTFCQWLHRAIFTSTATACLLITPSPSTTKEDSNVNRPFDSEMQNQQQRLTKTVASSLIAILLMTIRPLLHDSSPSPSALTVSCQIYDHCIKHVFLPVITSSSHLPTGLTDEDNPTGHRPIIIRSMVYITRFFLHNRLKLFDMNETAARTLYCHWMEHHLTTLHTVYHSILSTSDPRQLHPHRMEEISEMLDSLHDLHHTFHQYWKRDHSYHHNDRSDEEWMDIRYSVWSECLLTLLHRIAYQIPIIPPTSSSTSTSKEMIIMVIQKCFQNWEKLLLFHCHHPSIISISTRMANLIHPINHLISILLHYDSIPPSPSTSIATVATTPSSPGSFHKVSSVLDTAYQSIRRVLTMLCNVKYLYQQIPIIITVIIQSISTKYVSKSFQNNIFPGIFLLFEKCDSKQKNQMFQLLNESSRAFMNDLHQEYLRTFKFIGK